MSNDVLIALIAGGSSILAGLITAIIPVLFAPRTPSGDTRQNRTHHQPSTTSTYTSTPTKSQKKTRRGGWQVGISLVIGAFLGYLGGFGGYIWGINSIPSTSCLLLAPTAVTITTPAPGNKVPLQATVQGTTCHIPNDQQLWIFVVPNAAWSYYPQAGPAIIASDGTWSASADIGQPGTSEVVQDFEILAVLANQGGSATISKYLAQGHSFTTLPPGTQVMRQVHVIRK